MDLNSIIIYILLFFAFLGAVDKIIGNKFGLGKKFDEGFMALGPLAIAMIGIISIAPVLAKVLSPIIVPIYSFLGADPSVFAGTILANDMGGYFLANQIALSADAALFSGLIIASMLGATIVFTIPVALGIIKKEDRKFLAKGILIGLISIPVGTFIGGLVAGFSLLMILSNLVPIIVISALIASGLLFIPEKMITAFDYFGKGIIILITAATFIEVFQTLTGVILIQGMTSLSEGFNIIGAIAIILIGAFPMLYIITKYLKKPLSYLGKKVSMSSFGVAGIIASLANVIPMFAMFKDMKPREKIINVAFAVCAAFVLGDHLGFTAAVNASFITPVLVGKLAGGIFAFSLALFFTRNKNL